jgi:hypothetical protein
MIHSSTTPGGNVADANLCALEHKGARQADRGRICANHHRELARALAEIVELQTFVEDVLERGSTPADGQPQTHGKRADPPAPLRLEVVASQDPRTGIAKQPGDVTGIPRTLAEWARRVCVERELTAHAAIRNPGHPQTVPIAVGVLERHLDWICEQTWVDEFHAAITAVLDQARRNEGGHAERIVIGPCPATWEDGECGEPLWMRPGDQAVRCRRCGADWSGDHAMTRLARMMDQTRVEALCSFVFDRAVERLNLAGDVDDALAGNEWTVAGDDLISDFVRANSPDHATAVAVAIQQLTGFGDERVLRILAQIDQHHPDYRSEWKPQ